MSAVALAVAAVLIGAHVGQAGSGTVSDHRGEVVGEPPGGADAADIAGGSFGHGPGGKVWHKVTIAGRAPDPPDSGGVQTLLFIELDGDGNGARECDYFVGRHGGRTGVFECGSLDRVAKARIVRTSEHSTKFTFTRAAIGDPDAYDWAFSVEGPSDGTWIRYDRLPGGDWAFLTHKLR